MKKLTYKIPISFFLLLCLWLAGLAWFIGKIPTAPSGDDTAADAIVVLTGGSNRIEYGLQLLAEGKGEKLFITGVHENITTKQLVMRNALPAIRPQIMELADDAVTVGHEAENTIGNAEETKKWLATQQVHTIRLVTSNYHMPRAWYEFSKTLPGIAIIPAPVMPDDFSMDNWWESQDARTLILSEYHKYLASLARHYAIEHVK